jgi:Transmembrane secretion effector
MAGSGSALSTWAPLRIGLFRALWIAALVSNVGEWMQTVGAQWLLVHGPHAAILVSLVQTADALPAVLFALVAGAAAHVHLRAAENEQAFLQAMARLRQSRLRTGASGWALYQDGQNPRLFIELFSVPSWEEHLRQHRDRQTGTDLHYHDDDAALSYPRPQTGHYLATNVHE